MMEGHFRKEINYISGVSRQTLKPHVETDSTKRKLEANLSKQHEEDLENRIIRLAKIDEMCSNS